MEIVFVGRCEVFVSLVFFGLSPPFLFPSAAKLIGPRTVCQFLKNVDFYGIYPLNSMSHLWGWGGGEDAFGDSFCRTV